VAEFWDPESGTFYDTGPEHDLAVTRPRSLIDGATPAANSVAADVLLRLGLLAGDPDADRRGRSILRAAGPAFATRPSQFGRMLCAADRSLGEPIDAVVAGDQLDPRAVAIRRAVAQPYAPDLVIAPLDAPSTLDEMALFAGKTARGGVPTAYVCRGYACDEPTSDPPRAAAQVAAMASGRPV